MAVDTPQLKIDPYQTAIPTVQVPPEVISGEATRPNPPLQGQFGRKGTGALAIGDAILKGFMAGHQAKEQRKYAQAQATITAADAATQAAYEKYQDALSAAGGKLDDPNAKAAYDAYTQTFNQSKQAKAQFVIPEKGAKGQKSGEKKGIKGEAKAGFNNIQQFFEANPHIVPQIALMTMTPKAPGFSPENRLREAQLKAADTQEQLGEEELKNTKYEEQKRIEDDKRAEMQRKVDEAGGIDAVLADPKAPPELAQTARRMKYEALDKESPEGKLRLQLIQKVLNKQQLTVEEKVLAGMWGLDVKPKEATIVGKNGHKQMILVDPNTNKQIPGSVPLDLGPPEWAEEYYGRQAADRAEIQKAVRGNPEEYGVKLTGDKKTDDAAISARTDQLIVNHDFGVATLSDRFGRTAYETQRDNDMLQGLVKELQLNAKTSWIDQKPPVLTYPDGKKTAVGRQYFAAIMSEFITPPNENGGVMGFRTQPSNPDGKSPEVLDAERKFLYQFVKNKMMTESGKKALTSEQADEILKNTALGQPVTAASGRMTPPPQMQEAQGGGGRGEDRSTGLPRGYAGITPPPTQQSQGAPAGSKPYYVSGFDQPIMITDEEASKLRQNGMQVEDVSALTAQ